jgi:hypothetical protein
MKGNTALLLLLIIVIILAILLFVEIVETKIALLILGIALAALGVISNGFEKK